MKAAFDFVLSRDTVHGLVHRAHAEGVDVLDQFVNEYDVELFKRTGGAPFEIVDAVVTDAVTVIRLTYTPYQTPLTQKFKSRLRAALAKRWGSR